MDSVYKLAMAMNNEGYSVSEGNQENLILIDDLGNSSELAAQLFDQLLKRDAHFYGKVSYLSTILISGFLLNGFVLVNLAKHMRSANSRGLRLQFNLCICDLLTSLIYPGSQIGSLVAVNFSGGTFLCKFLRSVEWLSVFMGSNLTACIGLNRAITVVYPTAISRQKYRRRVRLMTLISLLTALACSLPQFFMWDTVKLQFGNLTYSQCEHVYIHTTMYEQIELVELEWVVYSVFILILRFWLPLVLILISYGVILKKFSPYCCHQSGEKILSSTPPISSSLWEPKSVTGCSGNKSILNTSSDRQRRVLNSSGKRVKFEEFLLDGTRESRISARISDRSLRKLIPKLQKATGFLVFSYVLIWLPYNLLILCTYVEDPSQPLVDATSWLSDLFLIKCVLNPVIWLLFIYGEKPRKKMGRRRR